VSIAVVYLASPRDWSHQKWTRLECLRASLKLLRKFAPPWPVIIFHENYRKEDEEFLLAVHPDITFSQVDFSTHIHRYKPGYRDARVGTYGYGMMCRFFSGVMQVHPLLNPYTHYIRLDDDSYIQSPITPEIVQRILSNDYTYRCTFEDYSPSLWDYSIEFMRKNGLPVDPKLRTVATAPYTNYHSSSIRLWKHHVVREYLRGIEEQDGCITKGWDDAIIQGVIAKMICPVLGYGVHLENGFCYRHNQHCSHRPGHGHSELCLDGNDEHHKGDINYQWGPPKSLC